MECLSLRLIVRSAITQTKNFNRFKVAHYHLKEKSH